VSLANQTREGVTATDRLLGDVFAAVDAAHAEAVRRGLRVVYPLTDEPWSVRRFFVEDPGGTIVNVLAHFT
jgi:uncharacterized glyoxalase superfamily protein PhnB